MQCVLNAYLRKGCWEALFQSLVVVLLCAEVCEAALVQDVHAAGAATSNNVTRANKKRVALLIKQGEIGRGLLVTQRGHQEGLILHVVSGLLKGEAGNLRSELCACPAGAQRKTAKRG